MPEVPIIIPVLVTAVLLGISWRNNSSIGFKRVGIGATLSAAANGGYAYILTLLGNTAQTNPSSTERLTGSALQVYLITSVLTGLLVVLAIFGIALLMSRGKHRGNGEETEAFLEATPEEEKKPAETERGTKAK